jgi:hypothetical protein
MTANKIRLKFLDLFYIVLYERIMLEQESYKQESNNIIHQAKPVEAATEQDLFRNYEIKRWDFSPQFYKILAASAIFNVVALVVFAQSNVLMRRGCDSPLVSTFCQVLDTVYVGSVLLGNDTEFASRDYEKTSLEDADITYIDVSGQTPPLNYPEGYFALANPEQFAAQQQAELMASADVNGFTMPPSGSIPFPTTPGNDLMNTTPTLPPPNPNPVAGNLPTSPLGKNPVSKGSNFPMGNYPVRKMPKMPKVKNNSPGKLPDFGDETAKSESDKKKKAEEEAKKEETKQPDLSSLPVAEEIINKKPLQDFGDEVLDKLAAKKVDLAKPFMVVMQGAITKDGKFDQKKSAYLKTGGDQEMIDVAKSAIEAIGDSGLLTYLEKLGVENINFTLVQDDKEIYAVIMSDQKSESKAKTISSGLNTAISLGKATVKEEDTLALLNAAKVESKGKSFVLNFKLDKPVGQELMKRALDKAQAKRQQQQQPNGTAVTKPSPDSGK